MKKIAILTDSSCDIPNEEAKQLDLQVLRMPVMVKDKEYIEGIDIDIKGVRDYLKAGTPVKTAQATLGSLLSMYETLLEEYEEVIHIPLSSGLSGMYQTALAESRAYDGRITVIDAKCACYPLTQLCLDVKELLKQGKSASEIKEMIEHTEEESSLMEAVIIPHDINYLKMGGRITPAAAALASLLRIVPILYLKHGIIDVYDKVHTEKKALQKGLVPILEVDDPTKYYWMVIADEREEEAKIIAQQMEEATGQPVSIHRFGAVILSHTGPGTIAFGRIKKIQ